MPRTFAPTDCEGTEAMTWLSISGTTFFTVAAVASFLAYSS